MASESGALDGKNVKSIKGYYVLGGNIDASGYKLPTHGMISTTFAGNSMTDTGFQGTFDGKGYTISNLTFGNDATDAVIADSDTNTRKNYTYSIFGLIGKGATLKNFAVTGVNFDIPSVVNMGSHTVLATFIYGATLENIYIQVNDLARDGYSRGTAVLAYGIYKDGVYNSDSAPTNYPEKVNMTNVVIDATAITPAPSGMVTPTWGILVARNTAYDNVYETATFDGVYVLSTLVLTNYSKIDGANIEVEQGWHNYSSVYRYENLAAWKQAQTSEETKNDFTSFDNEFWTVVNGVPEFIKK